MPHTKGGILIKIAHWIGINIPYITTFLVVSLIILNLVLHKKENIEYSDILLDKTFENVNEIYINNEFGKSFILKDPQRSRIVVQKKDIGDHNTNVIKIDILK
ncbi:MAG: hypothetical protein RBS24_07205 [Bacilli bacterium]|nr:hypothetical protein [Bacilli bacterium]